ncbi:hypothetical protein RHMOL_Rhmol10G0158600 [Rhododendron molle]|uniref:Uncharacterized protein n=3 Tax=Rhododendron molle TaxID=49168 RepID=A0ACC0M2Q9_RHOML|nr:hypothetical protein RHMOL_Rhmol10G0158600 [Rhododendron molle]KAI8535240.1 hypothetical protein RHMOL_Rhmol10G0158600 [Rhododendron molle]KAI8535241.1 hypothetical protein RHMOL_Rhmol10G0158600 [Rhododendron molle]
MPYVTEELWQRLHLGIVICTRKDSIRLCEYPSVVEPSGLSLSLTLDLDLSTSTEEAYHHSSPHVASPCCSLINCEVTLGRITGQAGRGSALVALPWGLVGDAVKEIVMSHELEMSTLATLSSLKVLYLYYRSATGIEVSGPSDFVPARLPTFHASAQRPWNAVIAYDACVRLCLHVWAKQ